MARERIPYFRFYPGDFMRGVRGMSAQEVGLYTMLLCRMYEESGPIEDHTLRLATYCGMREATFEKTLQKLVDLGKIVRADGMLWNERAEIEISNRAHDLKIASTAGKASAKKRQQNQAMSATTVERPFNHTDTYTDTERDTNVSLALIAPENVPDLFSEFWDQYPHRNGAKKGKTAARKKWDAALKARASPQQIIAGALRYANDRQVIQGYAKDPATWLHGKGWEDDVETDHGRSGSGPSGPRNGMVDAFAAVAARRSASASRGGGHGGGFI